MNDTCINDAGTLFETISPDIWQSTVLAADGSALGVAVAEIVEPRACAVRYLILFNPQQNCRLLLPATYVIDAEAGHILCTIPPHVAANLPLCPPTLSRAAEEAVHQQLDCRPYWLLGTDNDDAGLSEHT